MKVTLDLPNELLKEMKLRAVHSDRKFKDVVAETIRRGLAAPAPSATAAARSLVQLPIITCPPGTPKFPLTGEDIDRILNQQEVEWLDDAAGH